MDQAAQAGDRRGHASSTLWLGRALFWLDDIERARAYLLPSLRAAWELGEQRTVVHGLEASAEVAVAERRYDIAAALLASASAEREAMPAPRPGPDLLWYERAVRAIEAGGSSIVLQRVSNEAARDLASAVGLALDLLSG